MAPISHSYDCRDQSENGMKQQRRAHFQMQTRVPAGQADVGALSLVRFFGQAKVI